MKGTSDVCGLSSSEATRPDSLVDITQTRGFPALCHHLTRARRGDRFLQMQLAESDGKAAAHMDQLLADFAATELGVRADSGDVIDSGAKDSASSRAIQAQDGR